MDDIKRHPISLTEVLRARKAVYSRLTPSPLLEYIGLSELIGASVYIKHENHHPTGSFKIRGGVNLMSHLKARDVKGVITFSTGNHAFQLPVPLRGLGSVQLW